MDPVEVLMKEYEFLRNEILDSIKMKYQIIFSGLTMIGFIIGGSASAITNNFSGIAEFLLFFVLPLFCITILLVWIGEIEKMQRIAEQLLKIENHVNALLDQRILSFENSLRKNPLTMLYAHVAIIILFSFIAIAPGLFPELIPNNVGSLKFVSFILVATTVEAFLIFPI